MTKISTLTAIQELEKVKNLIVTDSNKALEHIGEDIIYASIYTKHISNIVKIKDCIDALKGGVVLYMDEA